MAVSARNSLGSTITTLLLCLRGVWLCSASAHLHKHLPMSELGDKTGVKLMHVTGSNTTGTGEGLQSHEQLWLMHMIYG